MQRGAAFLKIHNYGASRVTTTILDGWIKMLTTTTSSSSRPSTTVEPVHEITRRRRCIAGHVTSSRSDTYNLLQVQASLSMVRSTIIVRAADALPLAASVDDEQVHHSSP